MISFVYGLFVIVDAVSALSFATSVEEAKAFIDAVLKVLHDESTNESGTLASRSYSVSCAEFGCRLLDVTLDDSNFVIPAGNTFTRSVERLLVNL